MELPDYLPERIREVVEVDRLSRFLLTQNMHSTLSTSPRHMRHLPPRSRTRMIGALMRMRQLAKYLQQHEKLLGVTLKLAPTKVGMLSLHFITFDCRASIDRSRVQALLHLTDLFALTALFKRPLMTKTPFLRGSVHQSVIEFGKT